MVDLLRSDALGVQYVVVNEPDTQDQTESRWSWLRTNCPHNAEIEHRLRWAPLLEISWHADFPYEAEILEQFRETAYENIFGLQNGTFGPQPINTNSNEQVFYGLIQSSAGDHRFKFVNRLLAELRGQKATLISPVDQVINRLESYRKLKRGWDGESAIAPGQLAIDKAIRFVSQLEPDVAAGLSPPTPMVLSDGDVALFWRSQDGYLEIGFDAETGSMSWFTRTRDGQDDGDEGLELSRRNWTDIRPKISAFAASRSPVISLLSPME